MSKVQQLVAVVVAQSLAIVYWAAKYSEIAASYRDEDECPCCVDQQIESQMCGYDHEADVQGEINAALLLSTPRRPLFVGTKLTDLVPFPIYYKQDLEEDWLWQINTAQMPDLPELRIRKAA